MVVWQIGKKTEQVKLELFREKEWSETSRGGALGTGNGWRISGDGGQAGRESQRHDQHSVSYSRGQGLTPGRQLEPFQIVGMAWLLFAV